MSEKSAKILRFEEAVNLEVNAEIEEIIESARKKAEEIISKAESECSYNSEQTVIGKARELKASSELIVSQKSFNAEKQTVIFRNKLVDDFFNEIEKKLTAFVQGDKYKEWLEKALASLSDEKAFYDGVIVYARKADEKTVEELLKAFPAVTVKIDKSIKLGGITVFYPNESQYIDKTIDDAFRQKKEAFVNNPEMQL